MPHQPISACYCHVIATGHRNLARLKQAGDREGARVELIHIQATTELLRDYLLYPPDDPRWNDSGHSRYWEGIRQPYVQSADALSVLAYAPAWEVLARSTGSAMHGQLVQEARLLRQQLADGADGGDAPRAAGAEPATADAAANREAPDYGCVTLVMVAGLAAIILGIYGAGQASFGPVLLSLGVVGGALLIVLGQVISMLTAIQAEVRAQQGDRKRGEPGDPPR